VLLGELMQLGSYNSLDCPAERHQLSEAIVEALASTGGKRSRLAETELRGELFSRVFGSNVKNEQRRERERIAKEQELAAKDIKAAEVLDKAESAQSEMSKAMAALVERGEKIERLDNKTKDLEAKAKNFGDLAAQLKNEVMGKKWYQL
jgi:Synaptobrevin